MIFNISLSYVGFQSPEEGKITSVHPSGKLSSRLQRDVDKMGRTVALNANAMVRSTVKTCLTLGLMVHLSWELTMLTCIDILLMAIMQNKYIPLAQVGGPLATTAL